MRALRWTSRLWSRAQASGLLALAHGRGKPPEGSSADASRCVHWTIARTSFVVVEQALDTACTAQCSFHGEVRHHRQILLSACVEDLFGMSPSLLAVLTHNKTATLERGNMLVDSSRQVVAFKRRRIFQLARGDVL